MLMREVRWVSAASVTQAEPECPSLGCQGWKWSLVHTPSNPASSASLPHWTSWGTVNCSLERT
jgi:hypothetical protein